MASPGSSSPGSAPAGLDGALAHRLQRALDAYAKRYRIPGASVTITWPDGRAWTGSTGLADVRTRRRSRRRRRSPIASMSKTFTAALTLKLVEEGRLRLDRRSPRCLPDVRLGKPGRPIPGEVTVRMLLDHTSGLADFFFGPGVDKALPRRPGRDLERPSGRWPTPVGGCSRQGKEWHYSNTNYLLLGLIAERVTGTPFAEQVRERFLDPLALRHAFVQVAERAHGAALDGLLLQQLGGRRPARSRCPTRSAGSSRSRRS